MSDHSRITIDEIVHAAGAGALRALEARSGGGGGGAGGGGDAVSIEKLVQSGFGVRFEIWAGGWPGPWGPGPLGGLGTLGTKAGGQQG
ncbi:MAG: hypothetical protein JO013_11830 [Alphaproteobacteria bacterium]|nr:hypothetical protein [Alphaproteobacteria bacterium]